MLGRWLFRNGVKTCAQNVGKKPRTGMSLASTHWSEDIRAYTKKLSPKKWGGIYIYICIYVYMCVCAYRSACFNCLDSQIMRRVVGLYKLIKLPLLVVGVVLQDYIHTLCLETILQYYYHLSSQSVYAICIYSIVGARQGNVVYSLVNV